MIGAIRGPSSVTNGRTYGYSSENLLKTATGGVTLAYDPMLRLYDVTGAVTTRFGAACPERSRRDGLDRIAEYNGSNTLQRRYVHGPAMDEPLVWYEGSGTTDRRFLSSDERGSVVSVTNSSGTVLGLNKYDEYGQPQSTNLGKFGYTGQAWLPEISLWYYKARVYEPELGRFLQTDPIGYWDSANLYAYVLNDPVNFVDPLGLGIDNIDPVCIGYNQCLVITGQRIPSTAAVPWGGGLGGGARGGGGAGGGGSDDQDERKDGKRNCNAFQRAMQKAGDAAADWAAWSFDFGLGSWTGGIIAKGGHKLSGSSVLGQAAGVLAGPIRVQSLRFSATATVSLVAYAASGQPLQSTVKKGIEAAINRALKKFSGPIGEEMKDKLTSDLQARFDQNRCR